MAWKYNKEGVLTEMHVKALSLLLCMLLLVPLAACGTASGHDAPSPSPDAAPTAVPSAPEPTPTPTPEPAPTPTPEPSPTLTPVEPYEFGTPLEESEAVADDAFFDTAVYLGDSRTEGLQLFSGLKHGDFYWARGMTVFKAGSEDYRVFEVDGQKYNLLEALALKQYESVYIMLGINELGYPAESYQEGLGQLLDKVIELQPDAVVYLQIMPPMNDALCRKNKLADYINNEKLSQFNDAITLLAAEKKVVLLNTAEAYAGEDGKLPAELASDGCHFAYDAYKRWADYLRSHVIDRERYFLNRAMGSAEPS